MKKTISMLLVMCLLFILLPAPVHAAASSVWVGGVKLTNGKYVASGRHTTTTTKPDEGYAYYKDGVLHLNDYYYNGWGHDYYSPLDGYPYNAAIYSNGPFNIKLTGENTLYCSGYEADGITSTKGNVTISGSGSLEIDSYYGIFLWNGSLTINNTNVRISSTYEGIFCSTGKATFSNACNVYVDSSIEDGIYAHDDISISNSTLTSHGYFDGLYSDKNILISNSTVTLSASSYDTSDIMQALFSEKSLKLDYSEGYNWSTSPNGSMTSSWTSAFKNSPRYKYIHLEPFTCEPRYDVYRIMGKNRYDTAAKISADAFTYAENVIIVSGVNYADGLAGVPLAYALNAPILLASGNSLSAETRAEISRLGASNAYIIGGTGAVSSSISGQLEGMGLYVERIYGATRFETAVAIAEKLRSLTGEPQEIFFAYAFNYPDALAISNVAAVRNCPILYIASNGQLDPATKAFATGCSADTATILGGTGAVGPAAEGNIRNCGIGSVSRIYGADRFDTCLKINRTYAHYLTGNTVCIATGLDYPDSLTGGVSAAFSGSPLVLCGKSLSDDQISYLRSLNASSYIIFGGTAAVNNRVESQLP